MQFHDLAREVFVEPLVLALAGDGIGTERTRIVEIEQHRRMRLGSDEHVGERPSTCGRIASRS